MRWSAVEQNYVSWTSTSFMKWLQVHGRRSDVTVLVRTFWTLLLQKCQDVRIWGKINIASSSSLRLFCNVGQPCNAFRFLLGTAGAGSVYISKTLSSIHQHHGIASLCRPSYQLLVLVRCRLSSSLKEQPVLLLIIHVTSSLSGQVCFKCLPQKEK